MAPLRRRRDAGRGATNTRRRLRTRGLARGVASTKTLSRCLSISALSASGFLVFGCGVNRVSEANYLPDAEPRSDAYYDCKERSQAPNEWFARGFVHRGAIDPDQLELCMRQKGFGLRPLSGGEIAFDVVTFPATLFWTALLQDPWDIASDFW